jgi:3-dehydroquinate synthase
MRFGSTTPLTKSTSDDSNFGTIGALAAEMMNPLLSSSAPEDPTRIPVNLADRGYAIMIQNDLLDRVGELLTPFRCGPDAVVVTNPIVKRLYGRRLQRSLKAAGLRPRFIIVPDAERVKSLRWFTAILDELLKHRYERGTWLLALGGGVVGDLTGFAASAYLRGVPFAQIPTTVVAQVDASIGGKTGVNHRLGKNLIGAFYQPQVVLIDPTVLHTLPSREYRAGLAEVIKYGVIQDAGFFEFLEREMERLLAQDRTTLRRVICLSCAIKADVVAADEREGDRRRILNFGHTLGHALETVTGYRRYKHGETVAIGMVAASRLSTRLGLADEGVVERVRNLVKRAGLPSEIPSYSPSLLLQAMRQDKKVKDRQIHFVLPTKIGEVTVRPVKDDDIRAALSQRRPSRGRGVTAR